MTDNELKLNELKEVNGGGFSAPPIRDKNTVSEKAVCQQCRHDLVYQPSKARSLMDSVQQHLVPICTNPDCPNFQKEQVVLVNVNKFV
jgi:hypothetical protein